MAELENVDYVDVNGQKMTPDNVRGRLARYRTEYFDRDLVAKPIVRESERMLHPERLTETERYQLDNSNYDLKRGAAGDKRFMTEFDYYGALIRATEDNADAIFQLKRRIYATYAVVHSIYTQTFNLCLTTKSDAMGRSAADKTAWFQEHYPALYKIDELYDTFLDEIEIELERWREFSKSASRMLTTAELSYQATGRLFNHKRGQYASD